MPTIIIDTSQTGGGISYQWDLMWDIKTKEDARLAYRRLQRELLGLGLKKLERMKELAKTDGFDLDWRPKNPEVRRHRRHRS